MPKRGARQSFKLKGSADTMEVAADGDVYVVHGNWYTIHHFATAKNELIQPPDTNRALNRKAALLGADRIAAASFDFEKQRDRAAIFERATGKALQTLEAPKGMQTVNQVAASADGRHVAVGYGYSGAPSGLHVFGADGKHLQAIALDGPAEAVVFSEDGAQLIWFHEGKMHKLTLGEKKPHSVSCRAHSWGRDARVSRRDGHLFLQWAGYGHRHESFLVNEATGKVALEVPGAEVASLGPTPETVVIATGDEVQVLDWKGKRLADFKRDRKTRLEAAAPHPAGFWIGAGGFLEVFDFSELGLVAKSNPDPKKKRAPNRPPVILELGAGEADQGQRLREALWANPSDRDTVRVYADWLAEHGGETQAQYIQLSLLDSPTEEQLDRAQRLRDQHRGTWLGPARPFVRSWSDSREPPGFVDRAWCEAQKLIEGFDSVLKLGPRLEVTVTSMRKQRREMEKKLAQLALGKLWALDLGANDLDDAGLTTLAPGLKGLRRLNLSQNAFSEKGLRALGAQVDTLEELTLQPKLRSGQPVADGYATAVLETPGFQSLKKLIFRPLYSVPQPSGALLKALKKKLARLETLEA